MRNEPSTLTEDARRILQSIPFSVIADKINLIEDEEAKKLAEILFVIAEKEKKTIENYLVKSSPQEYYDDIIACTKQVYRASEALSQKCQVPPHSSDKIRINYIRKKMKKFQVLKQAILALRKSEEMPAGWEWHGRALWIDQQRIKQDSSFYRHFQNALKAIGDLYKEKRGLRIFPAVFISYAWPTKKNRQIEDWVQSFLVELQKALAWVGFTVVIDLRNVFIGGDANDYMNKVKEYDYTLLFCTPSLKEKCEDKKFHAIKIEMSKTIIKFNEDIELIGEGNVLPLAIEGINGDNYPDWFNLNKVVFDFRNRSYVDNLKLLLRQMLGLNLSSDAFRKAWSPIQSSPYVKRVTEEDYQNAMGQGSKRSRKSNPSKDTVKFPIEMRKKSRSKANQTKKTNTRKEHKTTSSAKQSASSLKKRHKKEKGKIRSNEQGRKKCSSNKVPSEVLRQTRNKNKVKADGKLQSGILSLDKQLYKDNRLDKKTKSGTEGHEERIRSKSLRKSSSKTWQKSTGVLKKNESEQLELSQSKKSKKVRTKTKRQLIQPANSTSLSAKSGSPLKELEDHFNSSLVSPHILLTNLDSNEYQQQPLYFTGRKKELRRIKVELRKYHTFVINQQRTQAICGLGGVGKTTLAKQALLEYAREVSLSSINYLIIWFCRAEPETLLQQDLRDLAIKLNKTDLLEQPIELDNMSLQVAAGKVISELANLNNWFLIYDNVEEESLVKPYIPQMMNVSHGYVLITSRNQHFKLYKHMFLDVFIEDDAVRLLWQQKHKRRLLPKNRISDEEWKLLSLLAEKLGYFPLALMQAGGCLSVGTSVQEYIEEFDRNYRELLELYVPVDYPHTLLITWEINFKRLSPKARDFLDAIAYLAPELQPYWFWKAYVGSVIKLNGLVDELENFSLISIKHIEGDSYFECHRLVQKIIQAQHDSTRRAQVVNKVVSCLVKLSQGSKEEEATVPVTVELHRYQLLAHWKMIFTVSNNSELNDAFYQSSFWLGRIYDDIGDFKQAQGWYEKAFKYLKQKQEIDSVRFATVLMYLGKQLCISLHAQEALPCLKRALSIYEEQLGDNDINVAIACTNLGRAYALLGNNNVKQKKLLKRALRIQENRNPKDDHPYMIQTLIYLGNFCSVLHRPKEAINYLKRSLRLLKRYYVDDHIRLAEVYSNMAYTYSYFDYQKSEKYYQDALSIRERKLGHNHPDTARSWGGLAWVLLQLNKEDEAKMYLRRLVNAGDHAVYYYPIYAHYLVVREQYTEAKRYLLKVIDSGSFDGFFSFGGPDGISWLDKYLHPEIESHQGMDIKIYLFSFYLLLRCEAMLGNKKVFETHLRVFKKQIKKENTPVSYRLLAYLYQSVQDDEMAEKYFSKSDSLAQQVSEQPLKPSMPVKRIVETSKFFSRPTGKLIELELKALILRNKRLMKFIQIIVNSGYGSIKNFSTKATDEEKKETFNLVTVEDRRYIINVVNEKKQRSIQSLKPNNSKKQDKIKQALDAEKRKAGQVNQRLVALFRDTSPAVFFVQLENLLSNQKKRVRCDLINQSSRLFSGKEQDLGEDISSLTTKPVKRKFEHQIDDGFIIQSFSNISAVKYFQPRPALLKDLTDKLAGNRIVAITGIAGSGKSQLAAHYADIYRSKYPESITFRLRADNQDNLNTDYQYLAIRLGIDVSFADVVTVINLVKSELLKKEFLLVFDNVDNKIMQESVEKYIHEPTELSDNQQVIITTQNRLFYGDENRRTDIDGFTVEQAYEFLKDIIPDKNDANKLARVFDYLPLGIAATKFHVDQQTKKNSEKSPGDLVSDYLKNIREVEARSCIEEVEDVMLREHYKDKKKGFRYQRAAILLAIQSASEENIHAKNILNFSAFFSPDSIPEDLLCACLASESKSVSGDVLLQSGYRTLQSYSLMTNSGRGEYILHRITQSVARSLLSDKINWIQKAAMILQSKFIYNDNHPETTINGLYFPHVKYLLDFAKGEAELLCDNSIIELIIKLAAYQFTDNRQYDAVIRWLVLIEDQPLLSDVRKGIIYSYLAHAHFFKGEYSKAENEAQRALNNFESASISDQRLFRPNFVLGEINYKLGNYECANKYYHEARKACSESSYSRALILHAIANVNCCMGYFLEALDGYYESFKLKKRLYGSEMHPNIAVTVDRIGHLAFGYGDYDSAKLLYEYALSIRNKLYVSGKHLDLALSNASLGRYFFTIEEDVEAKKYFKEALAIYDEVKCDHPDKTFVLIGLARLNIRQKNIHEVEMYLEQALEILQSEYEQEKNIYWADYCCVKGDFYVESELSNYEGALEEYMKALEIYNFNYESRSHVGKAEIHGKLIYCYEQLGDVSEANTHISQKKEIEESLSEIKNQGAKKINEILHQEGCERDIKVLLSVEEMHNLSDGTSENEVQKKIDDAFKSSARIQLKNANKSTLLQDTGSTLFSAEKSTSYARVFEHDTRRSTIESHQSEDGRKQKTSTSWSEEEQEHQSTIDAIEASEEFTSVTSRATRVTKKRSPFLRSALFGSSVDEAILASQRSINKISIMGVEKTCRVVHAYGNGDCGFAATSRYLELHGYHKLANEFTRSYMIGLIKEVYGSSETSEEEKDLIKSMVEADGATGLKDWCEKFSKSGYWLDQSHFQWLSYHYNIHFYFYYTSRELGEEGVFFPEPTYDSIYNGRDSKDKIDVLLAHVNTRQESYLNHFDAIIVEPTEEKNAKIDEYNDERLSFTHSTEVSAIHSGVSSYEKSRILTQEEMELNIALARSQGQDAVGKSSESSKFLTNFDFFSSSSEGIFEDEIPDEGDNPGNWSSDISDEESSFSL